MENVDEHRGRLLDAFEERVHRVPDCECWLWGGHINRRHGYGEYMPARGVRWRAHRLSYVLHKGPLAEGRCVLHTCDHPWCVNPAHLVEGDIADNNADMVAKRRHSQQRRTHCPKGHPLADAKTDSNGHRRCRYCYPAAKDYGARAPSPQR
jgi:hypothetical protein